MEKETHVIVREIGIDAGHRVTHHGSKCRNLHGHRYTIRAGVRGPLFATGEQEGMVLDFGFLKDEMMNEIDAPCDHGTILWDQDPLIQLLTGGALNDIIAHSIKNSGFHLHVADTRANNDVYTYVGKLYIIPFVPTAENLARHWFQRLEPRVWDRTGSHAQLEFIEVWETPNCSAIYHKKPS